MKKIFLCFFMFLSLSLSLFTQDYFVLTEGEDYLERLSENNLYFGYIRDIAYDNGLLYFLDFKYCKVIVVDYETAKLKKSMFRRGQGPFELMLPMSLIVKNKKIFVLDQGFHGVKIVDLDGKPVKEFKTAGMVGRRNIDVNTKDEIFVGEFSTKDKTYVSVYDLKGQKIRSLVKMGSEDKLSPQRMFYKILLDQEGNILVLFPIIKELKKFNPKGELTWEIKVKNTLLDKGAGDDGVKVGKRGSLTVSLSIFDMVLTHSNDTLLGHDYGGCIIDENGRLKTILDMKPENFLQSLEIIGNKLINVSLAGTEIHLHNITGIIK